MAATLPETKVYGDNPLAVDEDHESRRQIEQSLELLPARRLNALKNTYSLFLVGQRRLGRAILGDPP